MRRCCPPCAKIARCPDNPAAEVPLPDAIHHHPRCQRILRICQPLGKVETSARFRVGDSLASEQIEIFALPLQSTYKPTETWPSLKSTAPRGYSVLWLTRSIPVIARSGEFAGRVCANGFPLGSSATTRFLSARISFVLPGVVVTASPLVLSVTPKLRNLTGVVQPNLPQPCCMCCNAHKTHDMTGSRLSKSCADYGCALFARFCEKESPVCGSFLTTLAELYSATHQPKPNASAKTVFFLFGICVASSSSG